MLTNVFRLSLLLVSMVVSGCLLDEPTGPPENWRERFWPEVGPTGTIDTTTVTKDTTCEFRVRIHGLQSNAPSGGEVKILREAPANASSAWIPYLPNTAEGWLMIPVAGLRKEVANCSPAWTFKVLYKPPPGYSLAPWQYFDYLVMQGGARLKETSFAVVKDS